jgi:hypothetical protein
MSAHVTVCTCIICTIVKAVRCTTGHQFIPYMYKTFAVSFCASRSLAVWLSHLGCSLAVKICVRISRNKMLN